MERNRFIRLRRTGRTTRARTRRKGPTKAGMENGIDKLVANAREATGFLKALSHEGRLMVLCLLVDGEKSVAEIERALRLRQPAISQQLARLRSDQLVGTRRHGKHMYYSLARSEVREVIETLHRVFCQPRFKRQAPRHRSPD
jgi:DNA-binding transcriptional ArsR family regulator